jgi:hypothetical protein
MVRGEGDCQARGCGVKVRRLTASFDRPCHGEPHVGSVVRDRLSLRGVKRGTSQVVATIHTDVEVMVEQLDLEEDTRTNLAARGWW